MKWLTDLSRTNPDKMTPFGRQVLADMNIHPEDWGLGVDVAHHPEFGTFEHHLFSGFQRARPTLSTRDSIVAESVRKDFRQLNRHDRRAFGQRHATMLASEIPPKEVKREAQQAPMAVSGVGVPATATEIKARADRQLDELRKLQKLVGTYDREIYRAMQAGDMRKASELRELLQQNLNLAANPAASLSQVPAEFGLQANNLNDLNRLASL